MAKIKALYAREILDSRGFPAIETLVELADGIRSASSVESGRSTGTYEAKILVDHNPEKNGAGVKSAIKNVLDIIQPAIVGCDATEQQKIDKLMLELDGTHDKSKLGANAMLSVSQAVMKAGAKSSLLPLSLYIREFLSQKNSSGKMPIPLFNIIEGGKHAGNVFDLQSFLVVPASSKSFLDALELGGNVYETLRKILQEKNIPPLIADEGGYSPHLPTNYDALNLLKVSIEKAGYTFSLDAFLGIDCAANSFKDGKSYRLKDKNSPYSQDELVKFYDSLFSDFGLMYMEDPFSEDDWEGWKKLYEKLSASTKIVGDDLTTTNPYRLQLALDNKAINGIVIKPVQIGTLSETIAVVEIARFKQLSVIVSGRSSSTGDTFLADFAVGVGADYVKFGAPARERVLLYNHLCEIQSQIEKI